LSQLLLEQFVFNTWQQMNFGDLLVSVAVSFLIRSVIESQPKRGKKGAAGSSLGLLVTIFAVLFWIVWRGLSMDSPQQPAIEQQLLKCDSKSPFYIFCKSLKACSALACTCSTW